MELYYTLVCYISAFLFITACILLYIKKPLKHLAEGAILTGIVLQTIFIILLWLQLDRPPMRTLGETRLWYSFFIVIIGYFTYKRWNYTWFLAYCILMSLLFSLLNMLFPENFDKTLMPALQSIWFVPHVIVYIFAYALLAAATLVSVKALYQFYYKKQEDESQYSELLKMADNIVYLGFSFLSLGLIFGALWAKEAWGHYWTWDPKETWAFITWLAYLIYIHYRISRPRQAFAALWMLALAFVFLLIAWMGVNYLPSAQNSVHVY